MTQEEKQLLVKDLYARLYTGTIVNYNDLEGCDYELSIRTLSIFPEESLKCYLRPMSSMTKEEKYTYRHMLGATLNSEGESIMFVYVEDFPAVIDWLLAHHFDYRGLIEEGLALEAPEGMYKTE